MSQAFESLRRELGSDNRHARAVAAIELGELGAVAALPKLRDLAEGSDPIVAMAAMYACQRLGEDRVAMPCIIEAVRSGDEELVQQAVHTVCRLGPGMVPKLTTLLAGEPDDAIAALKLLAEIGGAAAHEAVAQLHSDNSEVLAVARELLQDWEEDEDG